MPNHESGQPAPADAWPAPVRPARRLGHRLSGRLRTGRRGFVCCRPGRLARQFRRQLPRGVSQPHLRHRQQRNAGGGTVIHFHGNHAGKIAHRRVAAGSSGGHVRPAAWWPGGGRAAGGRDPRCIHRHRWRHGGGDGIDFLADDVAPRLRPQACLRCHLRIGHPGPDHSAVIDIGPARRPVGKCLPAGAAQAGNLRARNRVGGRPVCRRVDTGPRPGRALPDLCPLGRVATTGARTGDTRGHSTFDPAIGSRHRAGIGLDTRSAGFDSVRYRDAHRSCGGRRGRRCGLRRRRWTIVLGALARSRDGYRSRQRDGVRNPDWRGAIFAGVPRLRRRRPGA